MTPIVTFHRHGRILVAACHGELDLTVRDDLWAALITPLVPASHGEVPLRVTYLDSEHEGAAGEARTPVIDLDTADPASDPATAVELAGSDLAGSDLAGSDLAGSDLAGVETVVVDLADVPFLDCTAVGVLVALARLTRRAGIVLEVIRPQPLVRRVFTLLGLDQALAVAFPLAGASHDVILPKPRTGGAGP